MQLKRRVHAVISHPIGGNLIRLALAVFLLIYAGHFWKLLDIPLFSKNDAALESVTFFKEPVPLGDAAVFQGARKTSLNQLNDERFILGVFWASWCGSCKTVIPKTIDLLPKFQEQGIKLAFVSTPDSRTQMIDAIRKRANRAAEDNGTLRPVTVEDNYHELFGRLELRRIPTFVLINKDAQAVAYATLNLNAEDLPKTLGALAALNNR